MKFWSLAQQKEVWLADSSYLIAKYEEASSQTILEKVMQQQKKNPHPKQRSSFF